MHIHNIKDEEGFGTHDALSSDLKESMEGTEGCESASEGSLFKNWPLMSSITVYCIFALHDMAYSEVTFFCFLLLLGLVWMYSFRCSNDYRSGVGRRRNCGS